MTILNKTLMILTVLLTYGAAGAATNGTQTFRFLFKSGTVLWIGEDIGGEYQSSMLHQVAITPDGAMDGQSELKSFGQWDPIDALKPALRTENALPLQKLDGGVWGHPDMKWTIQPPLDDATLGEAFSVHIQTGGSNAASFYRAHKEPAKQTPRVNGAVFEPLLFSDRGLFFNYRIEAAWFFPRSGLLLVFTRQPTPAVGLDTMHGFVILRQKPDNS